MFNVTRFLIWRKKKFCPHMNCPRKTYISLQKDMLGKNPVGPLTAIKENHLLTSLMCIVFCHHPGSSQRFKSFSFYVVSYQSEATQNNWHWVLSIWCCIDLESGGRESKDLNFILFQSHILVSAKHWFCGPL